MEKLAESFETLACHAGVGVTAVVETQYSQEQLQGVRHMLQNACDVVAGGEFPSLSNGGDTIIRSSVTILLKALGLRE